MKIKDTVSSRLWTGIPPWILIGAVVILLPIFSFITIENINRQREHTERLLKEKGAALIRSFEAGTRTGMVDRWAGFQLQRLLIETAQQPDIDHLIVTDVSGVIVASSNPEQIGRIYGKDLNLEAISESPNIFWRIIASESGKKTFEVYRRFTPTRLPVGMGRNRFKNGLRFHPMMPFPERFPHHDRPDGDGPPPPPPDESVSRVIFVGLDMQGIEEARHSDDVHTVIMGIILLFIGFAGVMLLLMAQNYRMTRASLSRIKAFSDTLVENMPIGLIALEPSLIITSFNQVADRLLNLSQVNATGKNAADVLPTIFLDLLQNPDIRQRVIEKQIVCRTADHPRLPLEVSAAMLTDETSEFLGYVLLFKDLREVQSLQKALARSQRLASIGSLAAGVAHEIRNPLSSIKGFATYFKERYAHIPEDCNISTILIQEVDRLNRVVSQLLEFSRPVRIFRQKVSIADVIQNTLKLLERQANAHSVEIHLQMDAGLPQVSIDPDQINQVLLNLLLNAVEAMPQGGAVEIRAAQDQDRLVIQISDTGAGIAETDLSRIFDPYFTTKPTGTGLGLPIVHNIVEAHGGDIRIESHSGKGAVVTIRLPIESSV